MKRYKVREFKAALTKKGFQLERKTTDDLYYLWVRGQRTQIFTKASMGKGEEIRSRLFALIRRQLDLDSQQLSDFIDCPLTGESYVALLQDKGTIARPPIDPPGAPARPSPRPRPGS